MAWTAWILGDEKRAGGITTNKRILWTDNDYLLEKRLQINPALFFALVFAAKCQKEGFLRKMKRRELELVTLHFVFSLSARISEIASHLMHDVETNPGPCENQVHIDS